MKTETRRTRRSTTNPTALVGRRLDWRRGRGRSNESALNRSGLGVLKRYAMKLLCVIIAILPFTSSAAEFFEAESGDQPSHFTPLIIHQMRMIRGSQSIFF